MEQVVSQAVELLHSQIEGDFMVVQKHIPSFLVWRKSCCDLKKSL
jgi:hypothetical protein